MPPGKYLIGLRNLGLGNKNIVYRQKDKNEKVYIEFEIHLNIKDV
jgi:hypothetical protein